MKENRKPPLISDIQKYSIHDGNGIRTTIFFKGCPLRCRWCHNPETQKNTQQLSVLEEKCISCKNCMVCPNGAIKNLDGKISTDFMLCNACAKCVDECYLNLREISGKVYTVEQLVEICEQDKAFYENSGGGITLSGGEVTSMNIEFVLDLIKQLYQKGYAINLDTCGYTSFETLYKFIPYIDTFLYDIKTMDDAMHIKMTGVSNQLILENLIKLSQQKEHAKIWIRLPIVGIVNNTKEDIMKVISFLKKEKILYEQINLLPYHNTGEAKYERFSMRYEKDVFYTPSEERLEELRTIFIESGITQVKIGG